MNHAGYQVNHESLVDKSAGIVPLLGIGVVSPLVLVRDRGGSVVQVSLHWTVVNLKILILG